MDGKRHIITIAAIGPDSGQTLTLGVYDALRQADALLLQAGDAQLLLRRRPAGCTLGPSMIGLEASSVNKLYDRFSQSPDYKEAGVLRDTDFDARRLFQMYDPSGNVVEIYAYLRNVREEILMH